MAGRGRRHHRPAPADLIAAGWLRHLAGNQVEVRSAGSAPKDEISPVAWTADSAATAVQPGQFAEFDISVGPLPERDALMFKALQTYSDGDVVRWIDEAYGSSEPEHPAPVLKLTKANTVSDSAAADDGDGLAVGLGIAGLVAGLAGIALGGLALARSRRITS